MFSKKNTLLAVAVSLAASLMMGGGFSYAQENPYAIETKVIKNEQAIQTLRQQQANLYLKMEDLLVKYGELKGRLDDIARRLSAIEARLNALTGASGRPIKTPSQYNPTAGSAGYSTVPQGGAAAPVPQQKAGSAVAGATSYKNTMGYPSAVVAGKGGGTTQTIPPAMQRNNVYGNAANRATQVPGQLAGNMKGPVATGTSNQALSDKVAFLAAKKLYDEGKYLQAIRAFERFRKEFKNSPYMPDAVFYTAESHFKRREYDRAIISYDYLINNYPKSRWVPQALLKEGISFIKLGDNIDGKYLLEKTIRDYPNSKEAKLAREYLRKLK